MSSPPAVTLTKDIPDAFLDAVRAFAGHRWPLFPMAQRWMLQLMMSESGVYAAAKNSIGCGGIIGFCPPFPGGVDPSTLDHVSQMKLVAQFWSDPRLDHITSAANLYQFNFVPASMARGTGLGTVIVAKGGTGYNGNEGAFYDENTDLDMNHDGKITVADLQARLDSPQVAGAARFKEAYARLLARPRPGGFSGAALGGLAVVGAAAIAVTVYEHTTGTELDGAHELRAYARRIAARAMGLLRG